MLYSAINTTFTASERDAAEESLNKELKSLFVQLGIDSEKVVVKITWVLIEYRRRDDATDPDDRYRMEVTIVFPAETSSEQQASQKMAEDVVTAITSGDVSDDSVLLKKATTTYVKEEKAPDEYVNNGKTYIGSGPVIGCIVVALVLAILIVAEIVYLANYHDTKYKGKPVPSNFVNVVYVDDDESSSSSSDDDEDDDEKEGEKDKKKKKKTMEEEEEKKKEDEEEEKKEKKPVNDTKAFEQSESESESESSDESSNESDTDESNEKKKKK